MKVEYQSPGHFTHACKKSKCYFCENMGITKHKVTNSIQTYQLWQPYEVSIIKADFSIIPDVPGRTYKSVLEKRWRIGLELGIKLPKIFKRKAE